MGQEMSDLIAQAGVQVQLNSQAPGQVQATSSNQRANTCEPGPDLQRTRGIPCLVCGGDALWTRNMCSQCKEANYCSEACNITDARFHKLLCTSLKYFTDPPNSFYRRTIVFDHDSDEPHFVWISIVTTAGGVESPAVYLATLIGGEVGSISIDNNAVRGRILRNRITAYFRKDEKAIQTPNGCVAAVVKDTRTWDGMTEHAT
jgi:hypothetical protein